MPTQKRTPPQCDICTTQLTQINVHISLSKRPFGIFCSDCNSFEFKILKKNLNIPEKCRRKDNTNSCSSCTFCKFEKLLIFRKMNRSQFLSLKEKDRETSKSTKRKLEDKDVESNLDDDEDEDFGYITENSTSTSNVLL